MMLNVVFLRSAFIKSQNWIVPIGGELSVDMLIEEKVLRAV